MTKLGHSEHLKIYVNPSKIYVNPGIKVHSNDLFSETTAPMGDISLEPVDRFSSDLHRYIIVTSFRADYILVTFTSFSVS